MEQPTKKKWQRNEISVEPYLQDYAPRKGIWNEDNAKMNRLKNIIFNHLTTGERNVIILYAETASQNKVAEALGVSSATVCNLIKEIRQKIKDEWNKE